MRMLHELEIRNIELNGNEYMKSTQCEDDLITHT